MRRIVSLLLLAACGSPPADNRSPQDTTPPVTTPNPAGLEQLGALAVTLTADEPATVRWTVDGTDPRTSETAKSAPSPALLVLEAPSKTTLTFSSVDAAGNEEEPKTETYRLLEELVPASLSGRILSAPALAGGQVTVALWTSDPALTNGKDPVRFTTLTANAAGSADWKFEGLEAGTYWVGAAWWPGAMQQGEPQAFALAQGNPVTVDPDDPAKRRADFVDVYLGRCDPEGPGVEGEVVVAERLLDLKVTVGLLDRPLRGNGSAKPLLFGHTFGEGARRPFALCQKTDLPAYLVATAGPEGATDPTELVSYPANPLHLDTLQRVTLHLGETAPELGRITGTLKLNGPLPGGVIQVVISDEPPGDSAPLLGIATVPTGDATEYAYEIGNLADGTYHVVAIVKAADGGQAFVVAGVTRVKLPEEREKTVDIEVGVGRVSGMVTVLSAPPTMGKVAIGATRLGETEPSLFTEVTLGAPGVTGTRSAVFSLFGLLDDGYDVFGVVDFEGDGSYENDFAVAGRMTAASPSRVTITAGGEVTADIEFDFTP